MHNSSTKVSYECPEVSFYLIGTSEVMCLSGSFDDYNVDDFNWEGTGNE